MSTEEDLPFFDDEPLPPEPVAPDYGTLAAQVESELPKYPYPGGVPPVLLEGLAAPTPKHEVKQRAALSKGGSPVIRGGKPLMLDYVDARFVQQRFDDVVSPANWTTTFEDVLGSNVVRCTIAVLVARPNGKSEWVSKTDVGVPSTIEPQKGSHSDAFKRAAVQWGVARDLYDERVEDAPATTASPAASAPTVRAAVADTQPVETPLDMDGAPAWVCPDHGEVKVVPAGVSQRTGKAYPAFYACPTSGCSQKGPRV